MSRFRNEDMPQLEVASKERNHPEENPRATRSPTAPTSDHHARRRQESWHHRRVPWLQGSRERWQNWRHSPSCSRRLEVAMQGDNTATERLIGSSRKRRGMPDDRRSTKRHSCDGARTPREYCDETTMCTTHSRNWWRWA